MGVFKRIELVYNSIIKYIIIKTNLGIVYYLKTPYKPWRLYVL